ncbi:MULTISPECIES: hypothetical protein [unclassified Rathayibacter]|uniref:hypothetical protein n=1 Tax=unclassified Rathayibacter TaxID=2609250 RepID=UPI0006FD9BF9|nr:MULTISPECIES: hypothetical protein [unclassified Rathayibacter]KQQ00599.1 hypothetical protein ASF42_14690 [Rathayibacter sp. Leaf294]KQS10798.1 hypothetical protein ASG06_14690 [Rathayibacter sp. Leaf185]
MDSPRLVHLWIVGRRSLCDNRAYLTPQNPEHPRTRAEIREDFEAPFCGSCLVLLRTLEAMANEIVAHRGTVWPGSARQAIENLPPSWEKEWDLKQLAQSAPFSTASVLQYWDPESGLAESSDMVAGIIPRTDERERAELAALERRESIGLSASSGPEGGTIS